LALLGLDSDSYQSECNIFFSASVRVLFLHYFFFYLNTLII